MTENIVEPTAEVAPSKLTILKSKITREGLIVGGILIGATIAGAWMLHKNQTPDGDVLTIDGASEPLTATDTPVTD